MKILPIRTEYNFEIVNHTAKASLEHIAGVRKVEYYFDDKLVGGRTVPDGDIVTDDDCIVDIITDYSMNNVGVYADLFKHHSDKIKLICRQADFQLEQSSIVCNVSFTNQKGFYSIDATTNGGKDRLTWTIEASDFSEAFEKARMILYGLECLNTEVTNNISALTNDLVLERIKWKE